MKTRHFALVLSLAILAVAASALPAAASCAMPEGSLQQRLENANHLFVGTVTSIDPTGRIADVTVEAVWRGDVGDTAQVQGGPPDANTMTSVDRSFEQGRRYLFAPPSGNGQVFEDNACSDTQPWRRKLNRERPEGAAAFTGAPPDVTEPTGPTAPTTGTTSTATSSNVGWIAGTAALALLALAVVAVLRRRSGTTPAP